MRRDAYSNLAPVKALSPAATFTTTQTSSVIDLFGYGGAQILVQIGAVAAADASNYFTFKIQEGDAADGTGMADISDTLAVQNNNWKLNATTMADSVQQMGYLGTKRYIRVVATATATVSAIFGVIVNKAFPAHA